MSDIVAFLAARYDEVEAVAKAADATAGGQWFPDPGIPADGLNLPDAQHMAFWSPARALREVAADRKLLAECEVYAHPTDGEPQWAYGLADGLLLAVKIRAERFADHPDYDEAWRP